METNEAIEASSSTSKTVCVPASFTPSGCHAGALAPRSCELENRLFARNGLPIALVQRVVPGVLDRVVSVERDAAAGDGAEVDPTPLDPHAELAVHDADPDAPPGVQVGAALEVAVLERPSADGHGLLGVRLEHPQPQLAFPDPRDDGPAYV